MKKFNLVANIYILCIIAFLLLNLFVLGIRSRLSVCLALLIVFCIGCALFSFKKDDFYQKKSVILTLCLIGIFQVALYYVIGFKTGFATNIIKINTTSMLYVILPLIGIITLSELIRYLLSRNYQYDLFLNILTIIMFILLDVNLFGNTYSFNELDNLLEFLGLVLFPSITCNIVFNKLTLEYGYKPVLGYRLITIITLYLIPYVPNVYPFFRAIFKIIIPLLIYLLTSYMYDRITFEEVVKKRVKGEITIILLIIIAMGFACLISCKFTYGLMTIGSGSMTGTINIGDAVYFEKYTNQDLNMNDIIIYRRNNKNIVHRIVEIGIFNGSYVYVTKGDNNQNVDEGYVYQSDVVGIVKQKIKYIGYPSVWLKNIFK